MSSTRRWWRSNGLFQRSFLLPPDATTAVASVEAEALTMDLALAKLTTQVLLELATVVGPTAAMAPLPWVGEVMQAMAQQAMEQVLVMAVLQGMVEE
jgi:hypothetical protein